MPITVTTTAALPGARPPGEDRIKVGRNTVVVLDGASGTGTSVSDYAELLSDRPIVPASQASQSLRSRM